MTHLVRKIPVPSKPKLEKELKRMIDLVWLGLIVIEPVQKLNNLVKGFHVDEKPNEKREYLCLPTTVEIFFQVPGHLKWTPRLDASSCYWYIRVDEQSSNILTFNTGAKDVLFDRIAYEYLFYYSNLVVNDWFLISNPHDNYMRFKRYRAV